MDPGFWYSHEGRIEVAIALRTKASERELVLGVHRAVALAIGVEECSAICEKAEGAVRGLYELLQYQGYPENIKGGDWGPCGR